LAGNIIIAADTFSGQSHRKCERISHRVALFASKLASRAEMAVALFEQSRPDVTILDLKMPAMVGI
jgi:CheY-like chemotaxis protein